MKGTKKKALWDKKRKENAAKRAAEIEANTARRYRKPRAFVELQPRQSRMVITAEMKAIAAIPSLDTFDAPVKTHTPELKMDREEYARREAEARVEIEKKKKRTAPLYNKGGYQYVDPNAPPEIVRNLGRKV